MPVPSTLAAIREYLDGHLRLGEVADYPNALNGLQLDNDGTVTRVGAAVDASLSTVNAAVAAGCDLLLVHHGLFWSGATPVTGRRRELFRHAFDGNLAVYSAHLPLDTGHGRQQPPPGPGLSCPCRRSPTAGSRFST